MDPVIGGALIGGGASVLGGFMGSSSASKAAKINQRINEANLKAQYDFAQNGIKYRVADAKQSGIHPLFALGAQTYSPSISSIGATADNSWGNAVSDMGQNIGRAVAAKQTAEERSYNTAVQSLGLEKMKLENDLLRAQTTQVHAATNPSYPSTSSVFNMPGQGNSGVVGFDNDGGADASVSTSRSGNPAVVPSNSVKNRIEDMIIPEVQWYLRQVFGPKVKGHTYNPFTSELVPDDRSMIYKPMQFFRDVRDYRRRVNSYRR